MESIQLEQAEEAQWRQLGKIASTIRYHGPRINTDALQSLGVVRSTPLEVDDPAPCDFEQRFFIPSYKDEHLVHAIGADDPAYVSGLTETARRMEGVWGETFDHGKKKALEEGEWVPPTPDLYPAFRAWWFKDCLENMQQMKLDYDLWWGDEEDERHQEARTDGWCYAAYPEPDDGYTLPEREEQHWNYRCLRIYEPRDPNRPHLGILMGDSEVARDADETLTSELHSAIEMIMRQLTSGLFSNHHTKPIIIYTLMSETHGRITQAHFDGKINKLVLRQSRILDFRGEKPTPDAYLMLRWMMSLPVGGTEYKHDPGHKLEGYQRPVPSQPSLVTTEAS